MPRTTNDISKLPKWAQDRITIAERDAEHYRKQLARMDSGESDTLIPGFGDPDIMLPPGSHIRFVLPTDEGRRWPHEITVWRNWEGDLDVNAGTGYLVIHPQASNSVRVSVAD